MIFYILKITSSKNKIRLVLTKLINCAIMKCRLQFGVASTKPAPKAMGAKQKG